MVNPAMPTAGFHELWQHSILCHLGAHLLKNQQPLWMIGADLGFPQWKSGHDISAWLNRRHHNAFFEPHMQCLYRATQPTYPGILKAWRQLLHPNASIMYSEQYPDAQRSLLQQFQGDPQVEYFPDHGLQLLKDLSTHHHTSPVQIFLAANWPDDIDIEAHVATLKKLTHGASTFCAAIRYSPQNHFVRALFATLRRHEFHHVLIIQTEHEDPTVPRSEMMIINPPPHYEKLLRGAGKYLLRELGYEDLAELDIFYLLNLPKPSGGEAETTISDQQLNLTESLIEEGHRKSGLNIAQRIPDKKTHGDQNGLGLEEHPFLKDLPEGVAPNLSHNVASNEQAQDQAENREHELTPALQQRLQHQLGAGKSATPLPTLRR